MKKCVIALAGFVVLAFGLITVLRHRGGEGWSDQPALAETEKASIKAFWDACNKASALRAQGDFPAAVATYRQCLKLNPGMRSRSTTSARAFRKEANSPRRRRPSGG